MAPVNVVTFSRAFVRDQSMRKLTALTVALSLSAAGQAFAGERR